MEVEIVRVYNVGFGDCNLLCGKNCNILVDCGTIGNFRAKYDNVLQDIKSTIQNDSKKNIGMLTHFHEDHFAGFKEINYTFDEFILPNFFSEDEVKLQLYVMAMASPNSFAYKFAKTLITMSDWIWGCLKNNGIIRFVKKGDILEDNIEILWPDTRLKGNASDILSEIEKRVKKETGNEISLLIDEIWKDYKSLFIEENGEYYLLKNEKNVQLEKHIQEKINRLNKIEISIFQFTFKEQKEIRKIQNQYSLVFQYISDLKDRTIEPESIRLLYLGDIEPNVFEKRIVPQLMNQYKIIKVSHHGTKKYFSKQLPKSEMMIISNGIYAGRKISCQYVLHYPEVEFLCTNNENCEFYNLIVPVNQCCKGVKKFLCPLTHEKGDSCGIGVLKDIVLK